MDKEQFWLRKLDAHSRLQIEEGVSASGVDVTLRLAPGGRNVDALIAQVGFEVFSKVDNIVTGHVDSESVLRTLTQLTCVEEVQIASTLFPDKTDLDATGEKLV